MNEETVETLEKAAEAIKQLEAGFEEATEKLASYKRAHKLAFRMLKEGGITDEELESKIEEYSEKTAEEMAIFEKAAELVSSSNGSFSFGKVGESHDGDSGDAALDFFNGLAS